MGKPEICMNCRGSGQKDDGVCPVCHGQGTMEASINDYQTVNVKCPGCGGNGRKMKTCTWCKGTGIRQ